MIFVCYQCKITEQVKNKKKIQKKGWYKTKHGWKCKTCHEAGI